MSINLYKPNSYNSGCAFSFEIGEDKNKIPTFYIKSIHQHSWDQNKKTGSFSENSKKENGRFIHPEHNIIVKLNEFEVGFLINVFDKDTFWQGYHSSSSSKDKTQIFLEPKIKKSKIKVKENNEFISKEIDINGFTLSLIRNGADKFSIFIEPNEAQVIKNFIIYYLNLLFDYRQKNKFSNRKMNSQKSEEFSDNYF